MARISLRVDDDDLADLDQLVERGEFANRSEAIRGAIQSLVWEYDARETVVADGGADE